eukprot:TRINITY_DN682_c0_g3_i2.p1 TRINITY_DN682_c0_g3~~TRINITY_DN682_c0_g3_i2.p1  ORF type:complete len:226 (+),score=-42.54 TRINITY_DN682_c0_g3_i2:228-905(+)
MLAYSLPFRPPSLTTELRPTMERSPTTLINQSPWFRRQAQPRTFSAQDHLTSELLRTLQMVAASKPTSWLSMQFHILYHLAYTLGPQPTVWVVSLSEMKLIPHSLTPAHHNVGIRSLVGVGTLVRALVHSVLYLRHTNARLALKLFRGERAISGFDWPFTPIHSSSPLFSTKVGSVLHQVLPQLQPGHGQITWFRVYSTQLNALFRLALASATPIGLTLLRRITR